MTAPLGEEAASGILGKLGFKISPELKLGGIDASAREAAAAFGHVFKEAMARTKEFETAGGELGESLMSGFQSVVAGRMPDLMGSFNTMESGITHLIDVAGTASIIGIPFVAAMNIAKPAFDAFKTMGGEFVETLTEVADAYQKAARVISASTVDPKNIEILTSSLRDLMAGGEIANLDAAAAAMGRLNANIAGLTLDQLKELTTTFVAAEEIVGRMDPTKIAGIINAFKLGPDQANEALTMMVNAARATGIEMSTLTDQVTRSGPAFRDMGYNAEQTVSFFAQMTKEGERGTRLVQGLSSLDEHLNKLVAGGLFPTVTAAWGQVVNSVKAYISAGDEAGARNFLASMGASASTVGLLFEDLKNGILDLPTVMATLGPGMAAPIRLAEEETMGLQERLQKIGQQFKAALEPVGASFSQALAPIGEHITVWLKENQEKIAHWATGAAKMFIDVTSQVGIFLADTLNAMGPWLEAVKDLFIGWAQVMLGIVEGIAKPLSLLPGRFGAPFRDFVHMADQARDAMGKAWDFDLPKALDKGDQWLHHFTNDIVPGMMKGLDTGLGKWFKDQHDHPGKADVRLNPKTDKGDDAKDSGDLVGTGSVDINLDPRWNPNVILGPGGLPQPAYGGPVAGAPGPVASPGAPPAAPGTGPAAAGAAGGAGGARTGVNWDAIAGAESGNNWAITYGEGTPDNPVSGGLQIGDKTWADYGGTRYTPRAFQATKEQQIEVAEAVLAGQGPGAWPVTYRNHPDWFGTVTPATPSFPPRVSRLSGGVLDYPAGKAIPALLHGQEYVMPPEQTAKYRPVLDAMRAGTLRSYDTGYPEPTQQSGPLTDVAGGLSPEIQQVSGIAARFGLKMISGRRTGYDPTAPHGSYHSLGEAGDYSDGVRTDNELGFAVYMAKTYGANLAELIHDDPRFQMEINDGKIVPRSFYASSGDHTNHVHVAIKVGAAPGIGTTELGNAMPTGFSPMGDGTVPSMPSSVGSVGGTFAAVGGAQTGAGSPGYGPGLGPMGPGGNQYNWARMTPEQAARVEEWQSGLERTGRELTDAQADLANKTRIRGALETEYDDLAKKYNHDVEMQGEDLAKQGQNYKDLMAVTGKLSQARKEEHDASEKITELQDRQAIDILKEPDLRKAVKPDKDAEKLGAGLVQGIFQELGFPDVFGKAITQWGIWKLGMGALGYGMSFFFDKEGKPKTGGFGAGLTQGAGAALNLPKDLLTGKPPEQQPVDASGQPVAPFLGPSGGGPSSGSGSFFTKPQTFPQPGVHEHSGKLSDFVTGLLPSGISHPLRRPSEPSNLPGHLTSSRREDQEAFGGLSGPNVNFHINQSGIMSHKETEATINKGIQAGSRLNSIGSPGTRYV